MQDFLSALGEEVVHSARRVVLVAVGARGDPERAFEGAAEGELGFVASQTGDLGEPTPRGRNCRAARASRYPVTQRIGESPVSARKRAAKAERHCGA
jgi:hypothetical protein